MTPTSNVGQTVSSRWVEGCSCKREMPSHDHERQCKADPQLTLPVRTQYKQKSPQSLPGPANLTCPLSASLSAFSLALLPAAAPPAAQALATSYAAARVCLGIQTSSLLLLAGHP